MQLHKVWEYTFGFFDGSIIKTSHEPRDPDICEVDGVIYDGVQDKQYMNVRLPTGETRKIAIDEIRSFIRSHKDEDGEVRDYLVEGYRLPADEMTVAALADARLFDADMWPTHPQPVRGAQLTIVE